MVHEPKETNPITPDTRNEEKESDDIRIEEKDDYVENQMKKKKRMKTI